MSLVHEIRMNGLEIVNRIRPILHMGHISILKCSTDVHDAIDCLKVGQKGISQSHTPACPLSCHRPMVNACLVLEVAPDEACDIHDVQKDGDMTPMLVQVHQPSEPVIWDIDSSLQPWVGPA